MLRSSVTSSNIAEVAYHEGKLFVKFHRSGWYQYEDVPVEVYTQLINAPSAGKYFIAEVRDKYHTTQLTHEPA